MIVLAVLAVGSVSATEDVGTEIVDDTVDEIVVDDVSIDEVEDSSEEIVTLTTTTYNVNSSMSSSDINTIISTASSNGGGTVNFAYGTYSNMALTVQNNVILNGNDAVLIGDGSNHVFDVTQKSNFTIKNFIIDINFVNGSAIRGHHVSDAIIDNNLMYNGKDGINIYQVHENLTITDNIIETTYDGISLVNFLTMDNDTWDSFVGSTITGNDISGTQYGMFFGGNFKGTIQDNTIDDSNYGIQFSGKRTDDNGRLNALIALNEITNVHTGIDMNNPSVSYLNMTLNIINTTSNTTEFAISNNTYFNKAIGGQIIIDDNELNGKIRQTFINKTDIFVNNTGYTIDSS